VREFVAHVLQRYGDAHEADAALSVRGKSDVHHRLVPGLAEAGRSADA
jgi:hypothetical protein